MTSSRHGLGSFDPRRHIASLVVLAVLAVASCAPTDREVSTDRVMPPGWREVVFTVRNESARAAHLFLAADKEPNSVVGTANPVAVPPRTTMDATLGLPPDDGWAVYLNAGDPVPSMMMTQRDVPPTFSGRSPVSFIVRVDGVTLGETKGSPPGWFQNP